MIGTMTPEIAEAIATVLYYGRKDKSGVPEIEHMRAVEQGVECEESRVVAWLHDAVEDGLTTFNALVVAGLSQVDLEALILITRQKGEPYMQYIEDIANCEGEAGAIAQDVKLSDNKVNMKRSGPPSM
jgi:hypothetical protein